MTKVLITGGGTAGHTNPGIAVAQALLERGLSTSDIHFVGGERGNEGELVRSAGFSIDLLPGRGILRSVRVQAIGQNLTSIVGLGRGVARALRIMRTIKPDVVLCLGGYAAFAASLAAVVTRTPLVVSEQNARASAVNRLFGPLAKACALPYPDTDLPKGELTGNPIRLDVLRAMAEANPRAARRALGVPLGRTVVAIWAGSLGATSINRSVRKLTERWANRGDLAIYHVVGRRDWPEYRHYGTAGNGVENSSNQLSYQVVEYENQMPLLLRAADIAVCRGGASTAAELAVAGIASILVPLPTAPRDHQRANGMELVQAGGALQIDDQDLGNEELAIKLEELITDELLRQRMGIAAKSVGRPGAADAVGQILLREAEGSGKGIR